MRRNQDFLPMRQNRESELSPWSQTGSDTFFNMSPWQMMRRMQEDMDRVFGQFLGGSGGSGTGRQTGLTQWAPQMDVSETDREFAIEVELPGVRQEDIDINVQDHILSIRAELRQEEPAQGTQTQGGQMTGAAQGSPAQSNPATGGQTQGAQMPQRQYHYRERRYGYFERALRLPENVDEDQIRCDFRNGVLMIHVPKSEQARQQGRRIPIGAGAQGEQRPGNGRSQSQREPAMAGTRGGEASSADVTAPGSTAQSSPGQSSQYKP